MKLKLIYDPTDASEAMEANIVTKANDFHNLLGEIWESCENKGVVTMEELRELFNKYEV
jgi:hypothetical protein